MSTLYSKLIAKHELDRRRIAEFEREKAAIESLPDNELEKILAEPTEPEAES